MASLDTHLHSCDGCFATLIQLRQDLAEADPGTGTDAGRSSGARAAVYAVAAVLCLLWAGSRQWTPVPDQPEVAKVEDSKVEDSSLEHPRAMGVLGFAADRDQPAPLRSQDRVLVIFAQFGDQSAHPIPSWAQALLAPGADGCGTSDVETLPRVSILPHRLQSRWPASAYNDAPSKNRRRFLQQVLSQVQSSDARAHDGNGDGVVDFVIVVVDGLQSGQLPEGLSAAAGLGSDFDAGAVRFSGHARRGALVVEPSGAQSPDICTYLHQAMAP